MEKNLKCKCGATLINAIGIGYYCPKKTCHLEGLTQKQYKKITYGVCEICGGSDKHPSAKYCHECGQMISDEYKAMNKNLWKRAIEIVRNKRGKSV